MAIVAGPGAPLNLGDATATNVNTKITNYFKYQSASYPNIATKTLGGFRAQSRYTSGGLGSFPSTNLKFSDFYGTSPIDEWNCLCLCLCLCGDNCSGGGGK